MRIAFVIHSFPPDGLGGSEVYTLSLASSLAKRHEVRVFRRNADPRRPEYETRVSRLLGIPVFSVNNTFRLCLSFAGTYRNPAIEDRFASFLADFRPQVVHFMHLTCLSTGLPLVCRRFGIPSVMTLHDYWLMCPRGQMLRPSLERCGRAEPRECRRCIEPWLAILPASRFLHRAALSIAGAPFNRGAAVRALYGLLRRGNLAAARASFPGSERGLRLVRERVDNVMEAAGCVSLFIAPSMFLARRHEEFGIPEEKIVHSDYGFRTPAKERRRQDENGPAVRLVFLGSLIPSKGLHVAMEALRGMDPSRISLDAYGGFAAYDEHDDYPERIRRAVARAPVRLLGPVENEKVHDAFCGADALLVPSIWDENSPLVIHEAFLAGLPVIASSAGGIPELVSDGVNGLLFETGSSGNLRELLDRVAETPAVLRGLMPRASEVKTIEENAAEIETLYGKAGA